MQSMDQSRSIQSKHQNTHVFIEETNFQYVSLHTTDTAIAHARIAERIPHHDYIVPVMEQVELFRALESAFVLVEDMNHIVRIVTIQLAVFVLQEI